jgi:16S rRNA (uracil1498-N3)-methyltransferase
VLQRSRDGLNLVVTERLRAQPAEPGPCLAFAPIRRARLEWLVEKAVELGAARLQPVASARAQAGLGPRHRLEAIVAEAAEQCGRLSVPPILPPLRLEQLAAATPPPLVVLDPGATLPLATALAGQPSPCLLIGPEGGLDPDEQALLQAPPTVIRARLPGHVLRAETAALAALAVWGAVGRPG